MPSLKIEIGMSISVSFLTSNTFIAASCLSESETGTLPWLSNGMTLTPRAVISISTSKLLLFTPEDSSFISSRLLLISRLSFSVCIPVVENVRVVISDSMPLDVTPFDCPCIKMIPSVRSSNFQSNDPASAVP